MFLFDVFFRLSREKQIAFYSANLKQPTDSHVTPNINHDFCLGPIRDFLIQEGEFDSNVHLHRVFQVRDPRDILVSQFYSFGWTHTEKDFDPLETHARNRIRNQTIDEYVLEPEGAAFYLARRLKPMLRLLDPRRGIAKDGFTLVTYEEMVLNFPEWFRKVTVPFKFPRFGWHSATLIQKRYQFRYRKAFLRDPKKNSHKRNVVPGEHRSKLKQDTIDALNDRFQPYLELFGYSDDKRSAAA